MKRLQAVLIGLAITGSCFGCASTQSNIKPEKDVDVYWSGKPKRAYTVVDQISISEDGIWGGVRLMVGNKADRAEKTNRIKGEVRSQGGDACINVVQQMGMLNCTIIKYR